MFVFKRFYTHAQELYMIGMACKGENCLPELVFYYLLSSNLAKP